MCRIVTLGPAARRRGGSEQFWLVFRPGQALDGVGLDQHVVVEVFDLVALGARVTVDALVLAAAVQVEVVVQPEPVVGPFDAGEQGFGLNFFDQLLARAAVPLRGTFPGGGDAA
jgi:hypothetical protein